MIQCMVSTGFMIKWQIENKSEITRPFQNNKSMTGRLANKQVLSSMYVFEVKPSQMLTILWTRIPTFVITPITTQHNLNTVVGLDMKMTMQTPPPSTPPQKLNGSFQELQINVDFNWTARSQQKQQQQQQQYHHKYQQQQKSTKTVVSISAY